MNELNFLFKRSSSRSWWNNICWNRHCAGGGISILDVACGVRLSSFQTFQCQIMLNNNNIMHKMPRYV